MTNADVTTRGTFHHYYVCMSCMSSGEDKCCTAIELNSLVSSSETRWYCGCCHARWRVRYGVLYEFTVGDQVMYCKGDFPPCQILAAYLTDPESFHNIDAESLANVFPGISPLDKNVFLTQAYRYEEKKNLVRGVWTPVSTPIAGHWKMNKTMYDNLYRAEWESVLSLMPSMMSTNGSSSTSGNYA